MAVLTARPTRAGTLWRGPIVHATLWQLFRDVAWGKSEVQILGILRT